MSLEYVLRITYGKNPHNIISSHIPLFLCHFSHSSSIPFPPAITVFRHRIAIRTNSVHSFYPRQFSALKLRRMWGRCPSPVYYARAHNNWIAFFSTPHLRESTTRNASFMTPTNRFRQLFSFILHNITRDHTFERPVWFLWSAISFNVNSFLYFNCEGFVLLQQYASYIN